jgi:hypothetical protein
VGKGPMLFSSLLLSFSLLPFYLNSSFAKNEIGMRLFLSALVPIKIYFLFFRNFRPDVIIALKNILVNDFLQKCVDNFSKIKK